MPITDKGQRYLDDELRDYELSQLRAVVGGGLWLATQTRVELAARVSPLQGATEGPEVKDLAQANMLVRAANACAHHHLRSVPLDWNALQIDAVHAAWANRAPNSSPCGFLLFSIHSSMVHGKGAPTCAGEWRGCKPKRVCRSTLAAEAQSHSEALDALAFAVLFVQ